VTVVFTNLLPFNGDFYLWEMPEVAGSQIWAAGMTDLGNAKKTFKRAVKQAGVLL